jgi:hypothetical protein
MNELTTFLAVWGAIVSTAAIIWNIRRDLVDRGRLRVICYFGQLRSGVEPEDPTTYLAYQVTNMGRRPVVVTHIGGAIRKGRHFMVNTRVGMPRTLQPGECFLEYTHDLSVLDQSPQSLWAIDSLGKHWKVPRKQLRQLLRDHQKDTASCAGSHVTASVGGSGPTAESRSVER